MRWAYRNGSGLVRGVPRTRLIRHAGGLTVRLYLCLPLALLPLSSGAARSLRLPLASELWSLLAILLIFLWALLLLYEGAVAVLILRALHHRLGAHKTSS